MQPVSGEEPLVSAVDVAKGTVDSGNISTSEIKFGYCTEFIIMLEKEYTDKTEDEFKAFLESIGDSIVVVSDDDIVVSALTCSTAFNISSVLGFIVCPPSIR